MNSYSVTEGTTGNADYYDRKQQQEQFDAQQKIEQQKVELQQQQVQLQRQQQDTNQILSIGGFVLASIIVLTVVTILITRTFKSRQK